MQTHDQWSLITTTFSILSSLLQLTCMHRFIWSPYVFVTIISRPPVSYWCVWRQASSVKGLVFMKSVPEGRNRGLFSRRFIPAALVVGLKVHWPVTLSAVGVLLLDNRHQKPFNPTPPGDSNSKKSTWAATSLLNNEHAMMSRYEILMAESAFLTLSRISVWLIVFPGSGGACQSSATLPAGATCAK